MFHIIDGFIWFEGWKVGPISKKLPPETRWRLEEELEHHVPRKDLIDRLIEMDQEE